jgi:hypothetical protein
MKLSGEKHSRPRGHEGVHSDAPMRPYERNPASAQTWHVRAEEFIPSPPLPPRPLLLRTQSAVRADELRPRRRI